MSLEDEFDIELTDEEVAGVESVGDVVSAIESKLREQPSPTEDTGDAARQ
jgi:hypothetical protein